MRRRLDRIRTGLAGLALKDRTRHDEGSTWAIEHGHTALKQLLAVSGRRRH